MYTALQKIHKDKETEPTEFEENVAQKTPTMLEDIVNHAEIFGKRTRYRLDGSKIMNQVLEPSLAKGNRIMVFCNTLISSRAVDHYLTENQVSTVNYHGEVPAEQRLIQECWNEIPGKRPTFKQIIPR